MENSEQTLLKSAVLLEEPDCGAQSELLTRERPSVVSMGVLVMSSTASPATLDLTALLQRFELLSKLFGQTPWYYQEAISAGKIAATNSEVLWHSSSSASPPPSRVSAGLQDVLWPRVIRDFFHPDTRLNLISSLFHGRFLVDLASLAPWHRTIGCCLPPYTQNITRAGGTFEETFSRLKTAEPISFSHTLYSRCSTLPGPDSEQQITMMFRPTALLYRRLHSRSLRNPKNLGPWPLFHCQLARPTGRLKKAAAGKHERSRRRPGSDRNRGNASEGTEDWKESGRKQG
ncbi:uncharacterized protein VTP21DRAFT_5833 [Calcarisporiella thermophila]|uniref:uncharacterized protein n=1 Tax=Calcarisporiella thermophila TaxID=911321 RepID=UPI003744A629